MSTYQARLSEQKARQDMVEVGRRMYHKGLVVAADGNLSVRLSAPSASLRTSPSTSLRTSNRVLITPSGLSKGYLAPEQLLVVDLDGRVIPSYHPASRQLTPSSETPMHLEVYRQRPDVGAVIHAHPPLSVAFTIAGITLAQCVLPEVIYSLGSIPTTEYATPSTAAGAEAIRELIRTHDAVVLPHHGTVTVGEDLYQAFMRLEQVEHAAAITLAAWQLGRLQPLPPGEVTKLLDMRRRAMAAKGRDVCAECDVCAWGGRRQLS